MMRHDPSAQGSAGPVRRQRGASLVVSLLMLVAILLLGISAAQIALQGEKASRNDRDRQIAFQAAEAALMDAEMDIENSANANSRSALFSESPVLANFAGNCNPGAGNPHLGMCAAATPGTTPVWQTLNLADGNDDTSPSVPFGTFTGQVLQTGNGLLPSRPPRYIIEPVNYRAAGEDASAASSYFYRITAIGFGARESTQSVLQTYYRKVDQ